MLPYEQVSYLTRTAGAGALLEALKQLQYDDVRVFDPSVAGSLIQSAAGWHFRDDSARPTAAALSDREFEILRHLADGCTVQQCAERLGLSASTVDNHKTRLMKKISVSKGAQLTRWAIKEGVVYL